MDTLKDVFNGRLGPEPVRPRPTLSTSTITPGIPIAFSPIPAPWGEGGVFRVFIL